MEISQIINLLLSSAVVAAIINVIIQNKNNKLHYITNERSLYLDYSNQIAGGRH